MAYSPTLADDRPNAESAAVKAKYYSSLAPEKVFKGIRGELLFRVAPRGDGWAGILVLDKEGKPVPLSSGFQVSFTDADGKPVPPKTPKGERWGLRLGNDNIWYQWDTKVLFTDASPIILPKTRIVVTRGPVPASKPASATSPKPAAPPASKPGPVVVDEVTVDFSQWKFTDSSVQMSAMLDGPTSKHGFVTAKEGGFFRDGKPIYLWGAHVNHIHTKYYSDRLAEVWPEAGLNLYRSIGMEEAVSDPQAGTLDPVKLDDYLYLIAKLGQKGVYFVLSGAPEGVPWGYGKGNGPKLSEFFGRSTPISAPQFWIDPAPRNAYKNALKQLLTTPNPHNGGKALKDDPTLICVELANETGLNYRRCDYNRVDTPEISDGWRAEFNKFLLKKYKDRESLAKAWQSNPLFPHEDPAKGNVLIPTYYRGRNYWPVPKEGVYGGGGQHNQYTTMRYYFANGKFGMPPEANPRVVDAIKFNQKVAKKAYPFDFNNLSTPEETEKLRLAFNDFLKEEYGDRDKLASAWGQDPLDPWEAPAEGFNRTTKLPDTKLPAKTIRIPSSFLGQEKYQVDDSRLADPRVSDAMEFTSLVQKEWATDLSNFLKKEIGVKCGVGWNGDTFHVMQAPNHLANLTSPLDVAVAAAYQDSDTGDQLTSRVKNLKRFNSYGRILGRPMLAYEWSAWTTSGPFVYEYALLAGLMGRTYGFDCYAHHQMAAFQYPISDPAYSIKSYIAPISDRPRRGAFMVSSWILQRSRIAEQDQRLIVGMPHDDLLMGGPERRMSDWPFENWLMHQIGIEDYAFKDVYDGPTDRVVIHAGWGPNGDYRKAKHAILWCHSNSGRDGQDAEAKKKWFKQHGIEFAPGQKYFLNDQFFATTEDMTDYNVVHRVAEAARQKAIADNAAKGDGVTNTGGSDYWAAEPDCKPTELDQKIYEALQKWGYPLPFAVNEIDKVWRSRDKTMTMDSVKQEFTADRDDMQVWFGKLAGKDGKVALSRLSATSSEKQYAVAMLPWDTGDFATAKTLAVWCMWNSEVTVKLPLPENPTIYAVNWLGKRLYQVKPIAAGKDSVTFATIRDDDVFCYEIVRP